MSIENLLTKIMKSYKKNKLSFAMIPESTSQENLNTHSNFVESSSVYPQHLKQNKRHDFKESADIKESSDITDAVESEHIFSPKIMSNPFTPTEKNKKELLQPEFNIIEWRISERKDINIPIDFTSSDKLYKEMTKNISAGGVFIETKRYHKLIKNQKIVMVFKIDEDRKPFKLTGKVIRLESNGIGVQFDNLSPFDYAAIEESLNNIS